MVNIGFLTDGPELVLLHGVEAPGSETAIEPTLRLPGRALSEESRAPTYEDLLLRTDGERVEVLQSPAGQATGDFVLAPEAVHVSSQRLDQGDVDVTELKQLGRLLFEALFPAPVLAIYARSLGETRERGLRIKVQLDSPELTALPWELMYDSARESFLALASLSPVVRYMAVAEPPKSLSVSPPLSILGVTAAPIDQPAAINAELEKRLVERALSPLVEARRVEISWLDHATPRDLLARLRQPPHILHYIGHGSYDPAKGTSVLYLEDADGLSSALEAETLAVLIRDTAMRLIFWNACETARGMAQSMVRSGIPAAIGTRVAVADGSAVAFAREFYRALSEGWPVDAAVVEGRKAVMLEVGLGQPDWAVPVLFMRSPDGVLFRRSA